ncbi:unnamed protein product [Auanema sp. JU1783]|nr:unnamed protein product [Auanema sp. JU1783]
MQNYTIILVLWKYKLGLRELRKPSHVRLFVVAPPRILQDESNVDVYYQVEPPMADLNNSQLLEKVRELCSIYTSSQLRLVVFERKLQRPIAQLRKELNIEGFLPDQLDILFSVRDAISNPRRNGLATLRQCSLSGTPQPEQWMEAVKAQIGGFPAIVEPIKPHTANSIGIIRNELEFKSWFRRQSKAHRFEEYLVTEYIDDGREFSLLCTSKNGIIGCISSLESHRLVIESIQSQKPFGFEFFSVQQTRDILPGLESFAVQVMRSVFPRGYSGILFIKGFYKNHNDIFFLGFSLEPEWDTFRQLLSIMKPFFFWECLAIENLYDQEPANDLAESKKYNAILNFPSSEGILIHQTTIHKRCQEMRVAWRASEGQEMSDSDSIDDNVVQIYLSCTNRERLLEDCSTILDQTDITIDKNVLSERQNVAKRNLTVKELIRSCTTTD